MKTAMQEAKDKAEELIEKFVDSQSLVKELDTFLWGYAIQCALICVEKEYHSLREQLINLRSCGLIQNDKVYLTRLQNLIEDEQQVKQEILNRQ